MPANLTISPIAREAPPDIISSNTTPNVNGTEADSESLPAQRLSEVLPPLVFGTATLNYQFNIDPYALHPNSLVSTALASGIRAFDTSPYYGPAEEILGTALNSIEVKSDPALKNLKREDYFILTKAGRIRGDEFDYSPSWIQHSVKRSLLRLKTTYLDVVYLHDVEFVSPDEVLSAIRTLRNIRDSNGSVHHVGICGYPVDTLASLSEMILRETGEPLDIVQSYANFTIQNHQLQTRALQRLINAGVDVVPNASPLGMGLLRSQGVPIGSMGNWHPAPDPLRDACLRTAQYTMDVHNEKLETVAVRFAMESWLTVGAEVGSKGVVPTEAISSLLSLLEPTDSAPTNDNFATSRPKLGVNVMGVSKLSELHDTMSVYNSIITGTSHPSTTTNDQNSTTTAAAAAARRTSQTRAQTIQTITSQIRQNILKDWIDYAWSSPDPGFVNSRTEFGVSPAEQAEFDEYAAGIARETQRFEAETEGSASGVAGEEEEKVLLKAVKELDGLEKSVSVNVSVVGKDGDVSVVVDKGGEADGDEKVVTSRVEERLS